MRILFQGNAYDLPDGATLCDAVKLLSPFGDEPVVVLVNGRRVEPESNPALCDRDELAFFPLLIGG